VVSDASELIDFKKVFTEKPERDLGYHEATHSDRGPEVVQHPLFSDDFDEERFLKSSSGLLAVIAS
jgi:hypothetical protein